LEVCSAGQWAPSSDIRFFLLYARHVASEDNRNVTATFADLDIALLWVRMDVPSRNSYFFDHGITLPILAEVL
jgi:hypothetical protein